MNRMISSQPHLGKVWFPEATISYPGKRVQGTTKSGVVVASVMRMKAQMLGYFKDLPDIEHPFEGEAQAQLTPFYGEIDPQLFERQCVWSSVGHNDRVDIGFAIQANRLLGTVGTANLGPFVAVAAATTGFTAKTKTDLSIGSITTGVTTNELTTGGFVRNGGTAGTPGNIQTPGSIDATAAVDVVKTFSVTSTLTAHGSAIFDLGTGGTTAGGGLVLSGSHLFVEEIFSSDAAVVNTDSLVVTWTLTM